jgi:alanine racemase
MYLMKKLLTWLSKRRFPYEPLIIVSISSEAILHNLEEFKKLAPDRQVAPVLKSNAYGHGLVEVAKLLETRAVNIPFFIVDSYFEAVTLRARGVKTPLLIIGYTRPETIRASTLKNVAFAITNLETLREISDVKRATHVHIKLDTGMHRQGLIHEEWSRAIEIPKHNPHLIVEGICSHLCDADNADPTFTEKQIREWNSAINLFTSQFPLMKFKHLSATDGHQFHKEISANLSRLGIGLYGITDNGAIGKALNLKPALEMQTIITGIKKIKKGDVVGYGKTFTADRDMTIATIPVGYFEGLDRNLSNKGSVLVGKSRIQSPIIGRVSMNITTIDVSAVNVNINDPVIVISRNRSDSNSIHGMVKVSNGRIPYEIVVRIPAHLKRVIE